MPLSFVRKALGGVEEQEQKTIRGGCRVYVDGEKIHVECDDGTRATIPKYMVGSGCVVYIGPDGKPRLECDRDISKILERLRR